MHLQPSQPFLVPHNIWTFWALRFGSWVFRSDYNLLLVPANGGATESQTMDGHFSGSDIGELLLVPVNEGTNKAQNIGGHSSG